MTISARFAPVLFAIATVFATGCNQVELDDVEFNNIAMADDGETGDDGDDNDDGADESSDSGMDFQDSHGALPFCGDGELNEGEECDDGDDNADNGACTTKCTINVCGDGLVFDGVEDCDGDDACEDDCTFPV